MRIVTSNQMRELDKRAMTEGGIPGVVLMENAGRSVFSVLQERYSPLHTHSFHISCGVGNNGGDGFVAARYLILAGASVSLSITGDLKRISGDALVHLNILKGMNANIGASPHPDAIQVDALLGTGLQGAPREDISEMIRAINSSAQPVVSIDIPSGVNSDTGAVPGEAVNADVTVTFAYPKVGMLLHPGTERVGELIVRDIGFDWGRLEWECTMEWSRVEDVASLLPRRFANSHKGSYGHVLVLGGSREMSGAVCMTALAALRTGAGLVTIGTAESALPLVASRSMEIMTIGLPDKNGALCEASFDALERVLERFDVLCIGPGGTRNPEAQAFFARVLREVKKPTVLDADGLMAIKEDWGGTHPLVITPHPGESAKMLNLPVAEIEKDRVNAVRMLANRYQAVAVLKGSRTLVSDGRLVSVNTTGNPGMATAGSGDALTGVIGALLAQGCNPWDAVRLGVALHGYAGDISARGRGAGLITGDLINSIPDAISSMLGE
jgi:hydroxyethylthiazole kinase-like uncharacterized protein yjeF